MDKAKVLKNLQTIPGVGKSIANDLYEQGYRSVADLKGEDPQKMYERQCEIQRIKIDPCVLYTFRCAVYFAEGGREQQKLKWWNWKE